MTRTIIITGIGGSIGIDVARSLRRDPSLRLIGTDAADEPLRQTAGLVDRGVRLARADREPDTYRDQLFALIEAESAAFAFINPDPELEALGALRAAPPCAHTMPPIDTVAVSLDKARTVTAVTRAVGAASAAWFPATIALDEDNAGDAGDGGDSIDRAFATLTPPLWIRSSVGAGGRGSLTVDTADEARAWIGYWNRRGKGYRWVAQELLPGANINWTGLYAGGALRLVAAMERVAYFLGATTASGVSGQVSRCMTIDPTPYGDLCDRVVHGLDDTPHGVYSVDLRHDRHGAPRVTEVNPRLAGRPWLYTNAGTNLALAAARVLTDQPIGDAVAAAGPTIGVTLYRQLDIEPVVTQPT